MSKDPESMLECTGMTTDGKRVIGGVYQFYETTGLPLDVIFEHLRIKNSVVNWIYFYKDAIAAGMKHQRILSKLEESICDVWGKVFSDEVKDKLNLIFGQGLIYKQRRIEIFERSKMCQLEESITKAPEKLEEFKYDPEDNTFPCARCGANMNLRCRTKIHGTHKRLRHPSWITARREQNEKKKHRKSNLVNNNDTITLYRPVGGLEYHLIRQSGNKLFPPRLEHQPIFYPVASEEYAIKIAKEWNTKDKSNGSIGFVMRFKIRAAYISMFDLHAVGGEEHKEYWIPSSDMERFNRNIVGEIETIHVFRGEP